MTKQKLQAKTLSNIVSFGSGQKPSNKPSRKDKGRKRDVFGDNWNPLPKEASFDFFKVADLHYNVNKVSKYNKSLAYSIKLLLKHFMGNCFPWKKNVEQ